MKSQTKTNTSKKAIKAPKGLKKASSSTSTPGKSLSSFVAKAPEDMNPEVALLCARAVIDKKALHSVILNVGAAGSFTDYFLISSGTSEPQVQAMADEVVKRLKARGLTPRVEGYEQGRWVLIDAGEVIAHLFHDDIRAFYRLEELWLGAPRVAIPQEYYTAPSQQ